MGLELTVAVKILAAIEFGKELMLEFAVENILSGKNTDQIAILSGKLARVQMLLISGSLYAALAEMQRVEVDELLTEATKQKYILKIRQYLGV